MDGQVDPMILMDAYHVRVRNCLNAASSAVLIYDYFLTFTREANLIWPSRWTPIKVLFLVTRYLPFFDFGLRTWLDVQPDPTVRSCLFVFRANIWLFYVGIALPEIILTMRTWSVWNRDQRLTIGLPIFFAVCWIPSIAIIVAFVKSLAVSADTMPEITGCSGMIGSRIFSIALGMLLLYEIGIFLLMLIQGIKCYRSGGNSKLFSVVFQEGLLYYSYLVLLSVMNLAVVATVPCDLQLMFIVAERCMHPIIACRAIIAMREQVTTVDRSYETPPPPKPPAKHDRFDSTIDTSIILDIGRGGTEIA